MNARQSGSASGFTLIELLIVVVVIGILASIAIPKYSAIRDRAFLAAMKSDLRNMADLQEVYYNANYSYTSDKAAMGFTGTTGVTVTIVTANNTGWSASATHSGLPGDACAFYHGDAAQVAPATVVSTVECTRY